MTIAIAQCKRIWRKPIPTPLDDDPSRLQSRTARGRSKAGRLAVAVFLAGTQMMVWAETPPAETLESPSAETLASYVADGKPWQIFLAEQNQTGTFILNPDGTGVLSVGVLPLQPKWHPTSDGFCMKPAMLIPERCVKLMINGNSVDGTRDGKLIFRLHR
jgi:hypothetical protein